MRELKTTELNHVNGAGWIGDKLGDWAYDGLKGTGHSIGSKIGGFFFPFFGIGAKAGNFLGGLAGGAFGSVASKIIKTLVFI